MCWFHSFNFCLSFSRLPSLLNRSPFFLVYARAVYSAAEAGRSLICVHFECLCDWGLSVHVNMCVCACVRCVCSAFSTLLGSLICFGSVWWAGHKANYLLKGKSEPNELHWATEVTGLIKLPVPISRKISQYAEYLPGFKNSAYENHTSHIVSIKYICTKTHGWIHNTGIISFSEADSINWFDFPKATAVLSTICSATSTDN